MEESIQAILSYSYVAIRHRKFFKVRETTQQNRVAEKMNMTLLEKVCCILSNSAYRNIFLAKALAFAFHLVNRFPSSAIEGKTLLEIWSRKVAQDYDSLRYLGIQPTSCQGIQVGPKGEKRYVRKIQEKSKRL